MNFVEELKWRGMLNDMTPDTEEHLKNNKVIGYIGFDPTAPSLTIGNLVQIMILKFFQLHGHTPVVLMGGATGRIGDPSGRDSERLLKSEIELDKNLENQRKQMLKLLDFESGSNRAVLLNNFDFYKDMNVLTFLRDVGKNITINYMLSKDAVKNRLESGLSFTEFSYQLLQAYDFLYLYKNHNCVLQMGGSDQWGNITSGTEFIRRNIPNAKAYAITTPLLVKSDGKKFGKSEEGNVWLDPSMTSPYKFYQFFINVDDAMLPKLLRYFSLRSIDEIINLENENKNNPQFIKRNLAEELTERIHGKDAVDSVVRVTDLLFNPKSDAGHLKNLTEDEFVTVTAEIPHFRIERSALDPGINIIELLSEKSSIVSSKSEARRAITGNAINLNKLKQQDPNVVITPDYLLKEKYILVENGKKNKSILEFV
ncbi:MAG: tyrosine--tRNA ligase [Deltaproteobacteria bacterium]